MYVVMLEYPYEGDSIEKVFDSEEKAHKYAERMRKAYPLSQEVYTVIELKADHDIPSAWLDGWMNYYEVYCYNDVWYCYEKMRPGAIYNMEETRFVDGKYIGVVVYYTYALDKEDAVCGVNSFKEEEE